MSRSPPGTPWRPLPLLISAWVWSSSSKLRAVTDLMNYQFSQVIRSWFAGFCFNQGLWLAVVQYFLSSMMTTILLDDDDPLNLRVSVIDRRLHWQHDSIAFSKKSPWLYLLIVTYLSKNSPEFCNPNLFPFLVSQKINRGIHISSIKEQAWNILRSHTLLSWKKTVKAVDALVKLCAFIFRCCS